MFDELDKSSGLIGTVEYGIDEFLMNEEGDLWKRDEPDPTLLRCARTYVVHVSPTCMQIVMHHTNAAKVDSLFRQCSFLL